MGGQNSVEAVRVGDGSVETDAEIVLLCKLHDFTGAIPVAHEFAAQHAANLVLAPLQGASRAAIEPKPPIVTRAQVTPRH